VPSFADRASVIEGATARFSAQSDPAANPCAAQIAINAHRASMLTTDLPGRLGFELANGKEP